MARYIAQSDSGPVDGSGATIGMDGQNNRVPSMSEQATQVHDQMQAAISYHASILSAFIVTNEHQAEVQTITAAYCGQGNVLGR